MYVEISGKSPPIEIHKWISIGGREVLVGKAEGKAGREDWWSRAGREVLNLNSVVHIPSHLLNAHRLSYNSPVPPFPLL